MEEEEDKEMKENEFIQLMNLAANRDWLFTCDTFELLKAFRRTQPFKWSSLLFFASSIHSENLNRIAIDIRLCREAALNWCETFVEESTIINLLDSLPKFSLLAQEILRRSKYKLFLYEFNQILREIEREINITQTESITKDRKQIIPYEMLQHNIIEVGCDFEAEIVKMHAACEEKIKNILEETSIESESLLNKIDQLTNELEETKLQLKKKNFQIEEFSVSQEQLTAELSAFNNSLKRSLGTQTVKITFSNKQLQTECLINEGGGCLQVNENSNIFGFEEVVRDTKDKLQLKKCGSQWLHDEIQNNSFSFDRKEFIDCNSIDNNSLSFENEFSDLESFPNIHYISFNPEKEEIIVEEEAEDFKKETVILRNNNKIEEFKAPEELKTTETHFETNKTDENTLDTKSKCNYFYGFVRMGQKYAESTLSISKYGLQLFVENRLETAVNWNEIQLIRIGSFNKRVLVLKTNKWNIMKEYILFMNERLWLEEVLKEYRFENKLKIVEEDRTFVATAKNSDYGLLSDITGCLKPYALAESHCEKWYMQYRKCKFLGRWSKGVILLNNPWLMIFKNECVVESECILSPITIFTKINIKSSFEIEIENEEFDVIHLYSEKGSEIERLRVAIKRILTRYNDGNDYR